MNQPQPIETTTPQQLGFWGCLSVAIVFAFYCALLLLCASVMVPWLLLRRAWAALCSSSSCQASLVLLLCLTAATAQAAKPEPLSYKLGGRRYVIAVPDRQLWSVSEVAQAASGHASGTLFIDGKEVRQARVRGQAGDRIGRNYLVVVMRTGKRLTPEPRYMVRPDPFLPRPLPPSPSKSSALSPRKAATAFSLSAPVSLRLAWENVPGGQPGGWGAGPEIMPDGGTRFWTVYSSTNLGDWTFCDTVTTNSFQFESINTPALFFRVHWRDEGAPAWRYQ